LKLKCLALAIALLAALPGYAHEAKGSRGGRLVDAGPYHAELVAKESRLKSSSAM
jgi:hypothetical protein